MMEFWRFGAKFVSAVVLGFGFWSCLWFWCLVFIGFGGISHWGVSLVVLSEFVFDVGGVWVFFRCSNYIRRYLLCCFCLVRLCLSWTGIWFLINFSVKKKSEKKKCYTGINSKATWSSLPNNIIFMIWVYTL